jgi:hypothetical protein
MAQPYRDIELKSGMEVRVYLPPYSQIRANVLKLHPEPKPPVITVTNVTGREISGPPIVDDPEYVAAWYAWNDIYQEKVSEGRALFMFKDVIVPEKWDVEATAGAEMRYINPEWAPREGEMGRKLDYIQWEILENLDDAKLIADTERELSGIPMDEVIANEASFPGQVEGETD